MDTTNKNKIKNFREFKNQFKNYLISWCNRYIDSLYQYKGYERLSMIQPVIGRETDNVNLFNTIRFDALTTIAEIHKYGVSLLLEVKEVSSNKSYKDIEKTFDDFICVYSCLSMLTVASNGVFGIEPSDIIDIEKLIDLLLDDKGFDVIDNWNQIILMEKPQVQVVNKGNQAVFEYVIEHIETMVYMFDSAYFKKPYHSLDVQIGTSSRILSLVFNQT